MPDRRQNRTAETNLDSATDSAGQKQGDQRPPLALFDDSHGQAHWAQTGFSPRLMGTNFAGLTELLCRLGLRCATSEGTSLAGHLSDARLLVLPPPTGRYDPRHERWRADPAALLTGQEVRAILSFLHHGGRLLAFAYRFGDSFTQTNLHDLFGPLGCQLNDDAVFDAAVVRRTHPLRMHFDTTTDCLPHCWSRAGVRAVRWCPAATFTLLPGANAWPLVLSPGGRCLSFHRTLRQIRFTSLPLAVVGRHGRGRFAFFGGPHLFETGSLGLLNQADNTRFLQNILEWLLADDVEDAVVPTIATPLPLDRNGEAMTRLEWRGQGQRTIAAVERILRRKGVLKALSQAKWMP